MSTRAPASPARQLYRILRHRPRFEASTCTCEGGVTWTWVACSCGWIREDPVAGGRLEAVAAHREHLGAL